jgi:negative regulator of flagellin synthesis FlgM
MSNPISSIFSGSPALDNASLDKTKRYAVERPADGQADGTKSANAAVAPKDDQLILSEVAQRAMAEPGFDRAKVQSIKQAIQDGSYPLNSRRIAESFAAIEKLIGRT